ncbi:phosphatase PAP2 family protein [uncultured Pseudodesulfovibrio sp.]|uniref:phosphatase PAP2 family protein n=1 Tax=uncultured Pseudodesulfovibrio sp. TaxID=2035858 RepID=UPI0029C98E39|nr:phosphatase PAP2 family protein [uncultured Pseudodesulfovibrio sp.]
MNGLMNRTLLKTATAATATALLIVAAYLFLDRQISEAALILKPTIWHALAKYISLAANGMFIKSLVETGLIVSACDALKNGLSHRSKCILYMCVTVAVAMTVGDVLKELFGRARPALLFEKGIYGFFPLAGDYLHHSFPSGHTLRIFSTMTALGFALPRVRFPALAIAILVGISRIVALKHYPSDVLFGAFIGITVAVWGWRIIYPYGRR